MVEPEPEPESTGIWCDTCATPTVVRNFVFDNIYFDIDKSDIRKESQVTLDTLTKFLKAHPYLYVEVTAFADSTGRIVHNFYLSRRRALAARQAIISAGIPPSRIFILYYGEEILRKNCPPQNKPCFDEQLQQSRRVQFKIIARAQSR